jgi:hypothetical protein
LKLQIKNEKTKRVNFQRVQVPCVRINNPKRQQVASWFGVIQAVKEARLQKLVPTNRKYIRGYKARISVHSNVTSEEYKIVLW